MTHTGPYGHRRKLTDAEVTLIYIRYQLWNHNRPSDIAEAFGISLPYVTMIGKGKSRRQVGKRIFQNATTERPTTDQSHSKLIPRRP